MTADSSRSFFAVKLVFYILTMMLCPALFGQTAGTSSQQQQQQTQSSSRKCKSNPPPEYPDLARKMNITGAARVLVTVAPDGNVGNVKELGGNPVLVAALVKAVKKWKYEPAEHASEVEVKYEFVENH
ncbi:MAG TPA: energy transducer TonB [Candidatus Angelobacter sp.]|nr:energy transducer TonB [Candidatus Angelobacter sp.]